MIIIRKASLVFRSNVAKAYRLPLTSELRQFSGLNQDENVSDNNKTKWEQLREPLHPYEVKNDISQSNHTPHELYFVPVVMKKPVLWLRDAKSNDSTSLKKVLSARDAVLRSLLKGKEENLVLQENNLSEFRLMKSKLIFPQLDESNQDAEDEKVSD